MDESNIIDKEENIESLNLGFIISVALNRYAQEVDYVLKEINLNLAQSKVLLTLYHINGVSIDELSKEAFMSKSSVTKSVKHLENKGMVKKEIDSNDNRKKVISVTDKGKKVQRKAIEMNFDIERKLEKELGEEKIRSLKIDLKDFIISLDSL